MVDRCVRKICFYLANTPNLRGTNICVENRQVFDLCSLNQQIVLMYGLYSKFGLYKTLLYSGFGSDMFHCAIKQCV